VPCLFWHLNCSHEPRQIASAALSHQAKQEQEQIDEIEIERQGAQYDGLAAKLGLPDLETLRSRSCVGTWYPPRTTRSGKMADYLISHRITGPPFAYGLCNCGLRVNVWTHRGRRSTLATGVIGRETPCHRLHVFTASVSRSRFRPNLLMNRHCSPISASAPKSSRRGRLREGAESYALMTAIRDAGRVYLVAGRKTSVRIDLGGCAADA